MNCKSVQNHLSAYLDRELSGAEMLEIRGHLGECAVCREEELSLRALKRLLAASAVPEPSADLADRLCASVLANQRAKPEISGVGSTVRTVAFTFLGVAACSMALTYSLLANGRPEPVSPRDMTAENQGQDLNFAVQRDQVYATGGDVTDGVPVLATPQDSGR